MRYLFIVLISLIVTSVLAQSPINSFPPGMFSNRNDPAAITYTGPGDVQSGATAFYSLRAYSQAYAAPGTNVAANIKRTADNHTCDLLLAPNGNLGNTVNCSTGGDNGQSALSWLGTDSTCTGTISSTTLSCTSASSTPTANTTVSGAGIVGLYIVSCGTFTSGTGTCTLNAAPSPNIGTPELVTMVKNATVVKWYDQSGNGHDASTSSNLYFNPIGIGGTLPIIIYNNGHFTGVTIPSTNLKYYTGVAVRQVATQYGIIANYDDTTNPNGSLLIFQNANLAAVSAGGAGFVATANDLILHSIQGVANGASPASVVNVDGTETTGTTGTGTAGTALCVASYGHAGGCGDVSSNLQGAYSEMGAWTATPNSTVRASMCNNMRVYWSTPGSC